ncbi:murein biosynthesis integral membrane protein MurJ [Streptomyces sannanensis]
MKNGHQAPAHPALDDGPERPPDAGRRRHAERSLARTTVITGAITACAALLGLARDQTVAHLFGAGPETDAFLVSWTVPEFASTLLIEDAMALVLVPAFSLALARREPVQALVRATLPPLLGALALLTVVLVLAAAWLVAVLAPGLPEQALAADCTRLTATCAFTFGLAGYCSAVLRAHRSFALPAAIYVAYNLGIIAVALTAGPHWGVRAAAAGVALGGCLMVLVQLPALRRRVRLREDAGRLGGTGPRLGIGLLAPVIVFAAGRQSQVLVERFLAAPLPAGAISHLNYAQKVAQMPMVLAMMLCTITFPVIARALARGDAEAAGRRMERDLMLAAVVVLTGATTVVACAPQIVEILFQRGAFDADDTVATASVMRVYALGLLGHTLVGALVRSYFSAARPTWYPAAAMAAGLAANVLAGLALAHVWGAHGIAAANAFGITVTAVLLLRGLGRYTVTVATRQIAGRLARLTAAALAATGTGWAAAAFVGPPVLAVAAGAAACTGVFLAAGRSLRVAVIPLPRKREHAVHS